MACHSSLRWRWHVAVLVGLVLLLIGFSVGFFGFKLKERYCPECGCTTVTFAERQVRISK